MTLPPLWPHQVRGIELAREAMREHDRVVLQLPTGAGKSRLGTEVAARAVAKGKRVLWLAHRTELVAQAFDTLDRAGLSPGCIAAQCARPARHGLVQVASIQTLIARNSTPDADLVIPDECHHLGDGAETWSAFMGRYPRTKTLGLTATPERGDGTGLAPMFTSLVQVVSVRELTEAGFLVPCEVIRPDRYLRERGATGNKLAQDPVDAWVAHCGARSGFIFASTVEEAQTYAERLSAIGIVARCVHAKTPADERAAIVQGFRDGRIRVLTNVYVFTEGTDLPSAEACVLARGAGTAGQFLQIVGRVLRVAEGKRSALLVDLPGVTHLHGAPEDERHWKLEGKACVQSDQKCRVCSKPIDGYPCAMCGYAPDPSDSAETTTEVLDVPLVRFARMIAQGPEQRYETAVRWLRSALLKGHKPKSVAHKWRAVYQEDMAPSMYARALREAQETRQ